MRNKYDTQGSGWGSFISEFIYLFFYYSLFITCFVQYSLLFLFAILSCILYLFNRLYSIHKSDLSYAYHIPKNLRMQNLQEENYIGIEAIKPTWLYWYALTFVRGGRVPSLLSPQLREIFFTTIYLSIAWEV